MLSDIGHDIGVPCANEMPQSLKRMLRFDNGIGIDKAETSFAPPRLYPLPPRIQIFGRLSTALRMPRFSYRRQSRGAIRRNAAIDAELLTALERWELLGA